MMSGQSTTVTAKLTDAEIRRQSALPHVREIKDPRHPIRLRYHKDRSRASYLYVGHHAGRPVWRKLATWPAVPVTEFFTALPRLITSVIAAPDAHEKLSDWTTFAPLLRWYNARVELDRQLSARRRGGIKSQIKQQLLPMWGELSLQLSRRDIDDTVMRWQGSYGLETVRGGYSLLRSIIKLALSLSLLPSDPLQGLRFSDILPTKSRIQPGRLRPTHAPHVIEQVQHAAAPARMLCMMMLLHGTRIGETRQARWRDFDLTDVDAMWHIPAETTKTGVAHSIPVSSFARHLLTTYREWQAATGYKGVYLFPAASTVLSARDATRCVSGVSEGEWCAHDLRKLARTRWADQGADHHVGEALLNHAGGKLVQTYIHTALVHQMRQVLDTYHAWITDAAALTGIELYTFKVFN